VPGSSIRKGRRCPQHRSPGGRSLGPTGGVIGAAGRPGEPSLAHAVATRRRGSLGGVSRRFGPLRRRGSLTEPARASWGHASHDVRTPGSQEAPRDAHASVAQEGGPCPCCLGPPRRRFRSYRRSDRRCVSRRSGTRSVPMREPCSCRCFPRRRFIEMLVRESRSRRAKSPSSNVTTVSYGTASSHMHQRLIELGCRSSSGLEGLGPLAAVLEADDPPSRQ